MMIRDVMKGLSSVGPPLPQGPITSKMGWSSMIIIINGNIIMTLCHSITDIGSSALRQECGWNGQWRTVHASFVGPRP